MSHTYSLICIESREVFEVGKIVSVDELGHPMPIQFGSWIDQDTSARIDLQSLQNLISWFLIKNCGHRIALVPESWSHMLDPDGTWTYYDTVSEFLAALGDIQPSEDLESRPLPDWIHDSVPLRKG